MQVSIKKLEKYNRRNNTVLAYKALYEFLVEGQEKSWEKWEKYSSDLTDREKLELKKKFEKAIEMPMYTKLVTPLVDEQGKVIRWHMSYAISLMSGAESCEVDVLGDLKKDLSIEIEVITDTHDEEDAIVPSPQESLEDESPEASE